MRLDIFSPELFLVDVKSSVHGPVTAEPSVCSSHEDNNNESSFLVSKENVRKQKQNMVTRYFFNNKEVSQVDRDININL